jgi:hypothetical protein
MIRSLEGPGGSAPLLEDAASNYLSNVDLDLIVAPFVPGPGLALSSLVLASYPGYARAEAFPGSGLLVPSEGVPEEAGLSFGNPVFPLPSGGGPVTVYGVLVSYAYGAAVPWVAIPFDAPLVLPQAASPPSVLTIPGLSLTLRASAWAGSPAIS